MQEAEETAYWLELLRELDAVDRSADELLNEVDQLIAILTTCVKNVKRKREAGEGKG